jgi:1-acyl-sn-glycerol-3-phosphate acyltransferase
MRRASRYQTVSNWFYNLVWCACWPAFGVSSSPIVLHRERGRRPGAYLLAANHLSPLDVPCIMKETHRQIDFISIVEVFRNPLIGWFYGHMGAFPLDRGRVDTGTTRTILDRLKHGRVVGIFPEGSVQTDETSVLYGGRMKPGVFRIAKLANVPIMPVVIIGTRAYHRLWSWLPVRRVRYGVNFGEPIEVREGEDLPALEARLREAFRALHEELKGAMPNVR